MRSIARFLMPYPPPSARPPRPGRLERMPTTARVWRMGAAAGVPRADAQYALPQRRPACSPDLSRSRRHVADVSCRLLLARRTCSWLRARRPAATVRTCTSLIRTYLLAAAGADQGPRRDQRPPRSPPSADESSRRARLPPRCSTPARFVGRALEQVGSLPLRDEVDLDPARDTLDSVGQTREVHVRSRRVRCADHLRFEAIDKDVQAQRTTTSLVGRVRTRAAWRALREPLELLAAAAPGWASRNRPSGASPLRRSCARRACGS